MQVVVLLSSYQGERFITAQLKSILTQLPPGGRIILRDDGSSDGTVACAEALDDARIEIIRGKNVGFVKSFFSLIEMAPDDADVVMLSDQDDIWLPGKIERAAAHLKKLGDMPALYCSRLQLVDVELNPLGLSPGWPRPPSFKNALTENIVTGCSCAINGAALPIARNYGDAKLIYFHDWWLYLVMSAFGAVIVDPQATILYRQHGGNAIGMGAGLQRYLSIFRFINKKSWVHIMYNQINNFRQTYGDRLSLQNRVLFDRYFDPTRRRTLWRIILSPTRFRQSLVYDVLLRLLLLAALFKPNGLPAKTS